jgi:type I restriction enzyme S subunit
MERLVVALPPVDEQVDLLAYIDRETRLPTEAIHRAHREIDLLREYRTRLIADVVTGKIDVCEAAARLPDEVSESQELEEADAEIEGDECAAEDLNDVPEEAEA